MNTRTDNETKGLNLGERTEYPGQYSPKILEAFPNMDSSSNAWTTFICTEFSSLCPKTGQPDFAKIFINYIADKTMVESKSLKLYLFSYRNHGDFHEDCINKICKDIAKLIKPKYLEVIGEFTPRGGISIFPYVNYSNKNNEYVKLKQTRIENYSPGKYSLSLSRIY